MLRLPGSLSPPSVAFTWRYPALRPSFRSHRSGTPNRGPGVRLPVPTAGLRRRETIRISQVPGEPFVPSPCSSTPAGPRASGPYDALARPPLCPQRRLPRQTCFRGSFARLWNSLFTLRPVRCRTRRKTRFRSLAKLSRTGLITRRVPSKGFRGASYISSSFPKLSWRKDRHVKTILADDTAGDTLTAPIPAAAIA